MPNPPARSVHCSAHSPQTLFLAVAGTITASLAAPALGITYLDGKHAPFHITRGQTGIATSVGSLEFRIGGEADDETDGGFRRSGQASGVIINSGQNHSWFVTAGHNLAPVGRFLVDEETGEVSDPSVTFALGSNYFTSNSIPLSEWYVSSGFGDSAGVISSNDVAIVPLPFTPAELDTLGVAQVPIFTRPTLAEYVADTHGEVVEIVGFGQTGDGASLAATGEGEIPVPGFDGIRRWGQNRLEPWLDAERRVFSNENDNYFEIDFDVDRDDDLYDITPTNTNDLNGLRETFYALKNIGEFTVSGGGEARQVPEEDFRVPFEVGVAPGDSGGGVFLGGSLLGMPISIRAVPLDADADGDEDGVGFGYGSDAQLIGLNEFAPLIENLIFFAEQAEIDFTNGLRTEEDLTDGELAALGWTYGAVDLNPIFNFPDQPETNDRRGNAVEPDPIISTSSTGGGDTAASTLGPEIQMNILEVSYYAGEQLSAVSKAKLIGAVPLTASDSLTDQQLIDLIANPTLTDIEALQGALDDDLLTQYGTPTLDRAIRAASSLSYIATNNDAPLRGAAPVIDLDQLGDYNDDGGFDAEDIDAFIAQVNADNPWADLDGDGDTDDDDILLYVESLLGQLMGDANLNGQIEQGDLDAVLQNWGGTGKGWGDGSFGIDGFVDQADLDAVLQNWGSTAAPSFALNPDAIPEPTSALALASLGSLTLLRRRSA